MPDVLFEKRPDGVALLTLNRPESLNAMGGNLIPELGDALRDCETDPAVRCVAITGAGRGFCAGGDMKGFASRAGTAERPAGGEADRPADGQTQRPGGFASTWSGWRQQAAGLQRSHERTSLKLHTMLKPTVALVNGPAAGAGMSVALSCDIRLFSDRGKLVPAFARIAFSGDFGGSYFLTKLIGFGRAREVYFLGEEIDAERALEMGIANRVVPHDELLDRGLEYCARIASGPPFALARMKENFLLAEDGALEEALENEARNMTLTGLTRDHREGVRAFVDKRQPEFAGE